jgi:hypothetical protein
MTTSSTTTAPRLPGGVLPAALLWLALAIVAGATGFLARAPFPLAQITILVLVIVAVLVTTAVPSLRAWIDALPLRVLIGINAFRFIGIAFLVLAARGELAQLFADRAGWGDIATAALAIVFVALGDPASAGRRLLLHAWNVFGFLDLVVAVGTATWVTLHRVAPGVGPLLALPFSVIPLFFVPIFLADHVIIFRRLVARGR